MNVEIPDDVSEEELEQIQKVLQESIAKSLGINPKHVKVTINFETGEATYAISVSDPTLAGEIQKTVKADDFSQNVNKIFDEKKANLPQRIQDVLEIENVKPGDIVDGTDTDVHYYVF